MVEESNQIGCSVQPAGILNKRSRLKTEVPHISIFRSENIPGVASQGRDPGAPKLTLNLIIRVP